MKTSYWIILLLALALVGVSVRLAYSVNDGNGEEKNESQDMDALECIMSRSSVREYSDKEIPDSVLTAILKAGMAAPTAMNKQPWTFIVVRTQEDKTAFSEFMPYGKMAKDASRLIVVCGDMNKAAEGDARLNWVLDCSAATENILLAAKALGVGSVWCGVWPSEQRMTDIKRYLKLPEYLEPLCVVCLGYPKNPPVAKDKWDPKNIIEAETLRK